MLKVILGSVTGREETLDQSSYELVDSVERFLEERGAYIDPSLVCDLVTFVWSEIARRAGRSGGRVRGRKGLAAMSLKERQRIAALGVKARRKKLYGTDWSEGSEYE